MTQRLIPREDAPAPAPRIFTRKRTAPPALSSASCWTGSRRLSNAPVMVATMCEAADADIFRRIQLVVAKEARRREAALAG